MEFSDGKIRLTHVVAALSISDQQEADKLLGDPLPCHVCTIPESHYLTPEVTFPVKTAPSVLNKVLDAAGGKFLHASRRSLAASQREFAFGWAPMSNTVMQGEVQMVSTLYTTPFMNLHTWKSINLCVMCHIWVYTLHTFTRLYIFLHTLHIFTCHYITVHALHTFPCSYITLHKLHAFGCKLMQLHLITCLAYFCMHLHSIKCCSNMHYINLHAFTFNYMHHINLHALHKFTCVYIQLHALHTFTCPYIYYI